MSYVLTVMSSLDEKDWMFNTLPDRSSSGGDIKSRINNFVNGNGKQAIHDAASKVLGTVKEHHKSILASALITGVTHAAHIDIVPGDLETHLHHQIEHLGTSLSISKTLAHAALTHAVSHLKALRGLKEGKGYRDDELDAALIKLHKVLKKLEPHYKNGEGNNERPRPSKRDLERH